MKVSWDFSQKYGALLICKGVQSANLQTWKIIKDNEKMIEINDLERERLKLHVNEQGGVSWNTEQAEVSISYEVKYEFLKFLKDKVLELDKKNMIPSEVLPLAAFLELA